LHVGERVAINAFVHIWANCRVTIGDNSMIASHVQITTSTHDYRVRPYRDFRTDAPVSIGRNVWIGSGAIVLPGVTIGDNSVIGAGSVVTRDVPCDTVVAGVPARPVRSLAYETSTGLEA
jgi:acetyltransferase-like isoleucine patch superfamily enzyme